MKIKKILIGLFCALITLPSIAQKVNQFAIETDGNVTPSQKELITNAFLYLNKFWADKGKSLSRSITEKYFSPDTTLIINGKIIYTGYDQFEAHFKAVGKHIIGRVNFPLLEVIGVNNKLIVHFDENIHDNNGNDYPANVMAIFTIQNNKIQKWEEVANTKYFCQRESSVVYSK